MCNPYSEDNTWAFRSISRALFTVQMKLLECEVQIVMKALYSSTMLRPNTWDALWHRSAKGWAMSAFLSWAWKKKKKRLVSHRQGGASERYCRRERHNGRQERGHIYPCLLWCITSPSFPGGKKNGHGGWWMAALTGGEQNRASPEGLRGANDYSLAKWLWLELHLNLVRDWTLNQFSNTEATVCDWTPWKLKDFIQTWISWFGWTWVILALLTTQRTLKYNGSQTLTCDVSKCFVWCYGHNSISDVQGRTILLV